MFSIASLSSSFLLLLVFLPEAKAGGHSVLSVEPYLSEWCAAQWPDKIQYDGYQLAAHMKYRDYVRIEPYLGNYCFDQFPGELASQKREATLQNMRTEHIQIEPYFMEWGRVSMRTPSTKSRINLERYIQEWCVKGQFRRVIPNHDQALANVFGDPNSLIMEPTFGKWCFAQFKQELKDLDEDTTVAALKDSHVPVEDYLIKWEAADYGARKAARHHGLILTTQEEEIGIGIGILIALVVMCPIVTACWWWCKRRSAKKDAQFQQSVMAAEEQINKEFDMGVGPTGAATAGGGTDTAFNA